MDQVRLAEPQDVAAVEDCVNDAFAKYVPRLGTRPNPMLVDYEELQANGALFVLGRPPTGTLTLTTQDQDLWIDNVAVSPAVQGLGHGRTLMAFAEAEGARRGARSLMLYTNELMTENQLFYAALGYQEVGRLTEGRFRRVLFQ